MCLVILYCLRSIEFLYGKITMFLRYIGCCYCKCFATWFGMITTDLFSLLGDIRDVLSWDVPIKTLSLLSSLDFDSSIASYIVVIFFWSNGVAALCLKPQRCYNFTRVGTRRSVFLRSGNSGRTDTLAFAEEYEFSIGGGRESDWRLSKLADPSGEAILTWTVEVGILRRSARMTWSNAYFVFEWIPISLVLLWL